MSDVRALLASDGQELSAFHVPPTGKRRGGLVVIQEIFGVNGHIRSVAEAFAAEGFEVLAPAVFDRAKPGVELGYAPEDVAVGRKLRADLGWDAPILDVGAAVAELAKSGKVASMGFCWGGSLSWLSAVKLPIAGAVCYYGGQIAQHKEARPRCPVLMHFGERDPLIPMSDVDAIRTLHPQAAIHTYAAGHGFNCDQRPDFDPAAAALAKERTLAFLDQVLAQR